MSSARHYLKAAALFIITTLFVGSCVCGDLQRDNPTDSGGDAYSIAVLTSGLSPDAVVQDSIVTIVMENPTNLAAYHYQLDNGVWQTVDGNIITLSYLDEGAHQFSIKMENTSGEVGDSVLVIPFTVNAIQVTSLMVRPRRTVTTNHAFFDAQIMLEELNDEPLRGVSLKIVYDNSKLRAVSVHGEPFLVVDTTSAGSITISRLAADSIEYQYTFADTTREHKGSGALITIRFEALAIGTTYITFDQANSKVFTPGFRSTDARDKPLQYYQGVVEIR